jgi:hypothetical protein
MPAQTHRRPRRCALLPAATEPSGAPARPASGGPLPEAGMRLAGRYLLADRAGGPDWSSVWKGTDELLSRTVAVRVFRPGPVPDAVDAAVRAAARLTDPRLVRVFDYDSRAEYPYVVSEWAPGERLDDLLLAELPVPALAATITAEAAAALAAAHAAGQAHLHLTPGRVRWGGGGVKITGLGIEAALRGEEPGTAMPGAVPGTAAAEAAAADTRALAGVLYALLTGYWPGGEAASLPSAPRRRGLLYPPGQARAGVPGILNAISCRALLPWSGHGEPILTPAQLALALRRALPGSRHRRARPLTAAGPQRRPSYAPAA